MTNILHLGDCAEVLKEYPDNYFDAIVCDPPAGISFMGKKWDDDKGGRDKWIAWMQTIAAEALRVMKPGAHALVWALPRTSHWTATAWENGGWEVRDRVSHIFGCLSEDTEILTDRGWEQYQTLVAGNHALCYNIGEDSLQWEPIQEVFTYAYEDTAYRIKSDSTDQIVSRNHRCIVERGGKQTFRYAETLEQQESVPVLENLHSLLAALPVPHQRAGHTKQIVQSIMQRGTHQPSQERQTINAGSHGNLQPVRQSVRNQEQPMGSEVLQLRLRGKAQGIRSRTTNPNENHWSIRPQGLDRRQPSILSGGNERRKQSGVERRRDLLQDTRQLYRREIYPLSGGIQDNGTQGRLRNGTSNTGGTSHRSSIAAYRSCTPYQSQSGGQSLGKSSAICHEQRPQTVRASRFTRSNLATVTPIDYKGIIWCVRVPSGAFIARRNGHIFITGNSGFPKSHNISIAIDKLSGAEREVIGKSQYANRGRRTDNKVYGQATPSIDEVITAPATDAAKQFDGFGTALKPAMEDWWLLRKPIAESSIAANVLAWGTGGLNIDASRIPSNESTKRPCGPDSNHAGQFKGSQGGERGVDAGVGRWPAQLIHDGSDCVMAEFAKYGETTKPGSAVRNNKANPYGSEITWSVSNTPPQQTVGYADTGTVARFFYCAKPSKAERNADGENNHPTLKSLALMRYLITLITPPGGIVLDLFAGSGTTIRAALELGFDAVGIEQDPEHFATMQRRAAAAALPLFAEVAT
jgi:DNA modification methylase